MIFTYSEGRRGGKNFSPTYSERRGVAKENLNTYSNALEVPFRDPCH